MRIRGTPDGLALTGVEGLGYLCSTPSQDLRRKADKIDDEFNNDSW
jgi:hypothetical protein